MVAVLGALAKNIVKKKAVGAVAAKAAAKKAVVKQVGMNVLRANKGEFVENIRSKASKFLPTGKTPPVDTANLARGMSAGGVVARGRRNVKNSQKKRR